MTLHPDDGSPSTQTSADATGRFHALVPPGGYHLSAVLPYQSCTSDGSVVVSAGATATTRVVCPVP